MGDAAEAMVFEVETVEQPAAEASASPIPKPAPGKPNFVREPAPPTRNGHGNNWGQPVSKVKVDVLPPDFDHGRQPDDAAPLGYKTNGDPWSPYGTTPNGRVRRKPAPTMPTPKAEGNVSPLVDRRLAPGDRKPPAEVAGKYKQADDAHAYLNQLVREIQKEHPASGYNVVPHPREMAGGAVKAEPSYAECTAEILLASTSGFLAEKVLKEPAAAAPKEMIHEAAMRISIASKYYSPETDPKIQATNAAVAAVIACFLPAILIAAGQLWEKFTRRGVK